MEIILSALFIMSLRIIDVSMGTIRTIMTIRGKKWIAGAIGFVEVTIWVLAIRHVMQNLDNIYNIFGYSLGFALGTIIGITIEQKIGSGYIQAQIISKYKTDPIADELRKNHFGVTILPGEGGRGGVAMLMILSSRKREKELFDIVEKNDEDAFISVQSATAYRGYIKSGSSMRK